MPLPAIAASQTPLEAQVADRSDEIAYTNHDLDDGLRSELLTLGQLDDGAALARCRTRATRGAHAGRARAGRCARRRSSRCSNRLVTDLVEATAQRLDARAARRASTPCARRRAAGSTTRPRWRKGLRELKEFLYRNLYYHPHVVATTEEAERVLEELWRVYRADPRRLPEQVRAHFAADGEARAIADYVAGMTDRFALAEHRRLTPWSRPRLTPRWRACSSSSPRRTEAVARAHRARARRGAPRRLREPGARRALDLPLPGRVEDEARDAADRDQDARRARRRRSRNACARCTPTTLPELSCCSTAGGSAPYLGLGASRRPGREPRRRARSGGRRRCPRTRTRSAPRTAIPQRLLAALAPRGRGARPRLAARARARGRRGARASRGSSWSGGSRRCSSSTRRRFRRPGASCCAARATSSPRRA